MTVECASVCQACGQPACASLPTIVTCPGTEPAFPIVLPRGGSTTFRVEVLDPDGAGDIVKLWVESVRGGADVGASLLESQSGEIAGLKTRKGEVVLTWRPGAVGGSAMVFARDACGREHFRTFYYEVVTPPEIEIVSGPTPVVSPCCGGDGTAWTLQVTDPTFLPQEQGRSGYCVSVESAGGGVAGLLARAGSCQSRVVRPRTVPTWRETVIHCSAGSVDPYAMRVTVLDLLRSTKAVWETTGSLQVNSPPQFDPTSLEPSVWTPVSYRTQTLLMDPAWYEIGCLRVTDRDGDEVAIRIGRPARYGVASVLTSGEGGEYAVTVTYQVTPTTLLAWHRSQHWQADSFTIVADDHRGGRSEIPVTVLSAVLNTAPTCAGDATSTKSSLPVQIPVLANDADLDGDDLVISSVETPSHGAVAHAAGKVTYTPAAGFAGEDAFTYAVSDGYGGTATGLVTVTVTDAEPPVFAWPLPFSKPIANDLGICGAAVAWTPPEVGIDVTDNVGVLSLTATHAPGDSFPVGPTAVMYTATDAAGNEASFSFAVEIEDREDPVFLNVPADIVTAAPLGQTTKAVNWTPPTPSDNCGIATVTSSHSPGDAFPVGVTAVTTTATDIHGNKAATAFLVTVHPPLVTIARDVDLTTPRDDGDWVMFLVETTGGCPPVAVTCEPESGSFFDLGVTTVGVTATDACGVVVTDSFTVTVTREAENRAPVARDDAPADMTTWWIVVRVLANDEDPDGDALTLISIGSPPCGEAMPSGSDPNAIYYAAVGCDGLEGETISFDYEVEDEHGAQARATVYLRIPDDIVLPRARAGG